MIKMLAMGPIDLAAILILTASSQRLEPRWTPDGPAASQSNAEQRSAMVTINKYKRWSTRKRGTVRWNLNKHEIRIVQQNYIRHIVNI